MVAAVVAGASIGRIGALEPRLSALAAYGLRRGQDEPSYNSCRKQSRCFRGIPNGLAQLHRGGGAERVKHMCDL